LQLKSHVSTLSKLGVTVDTEHENDASHFVCHIRDNSLLSGMDGLYSKKKKKTIRRLKEGREEG